MCLTEMQMGGILVGIEALGSVINLVLVCFGLNECEDTRTLAFGS